MMCFPYHSKNAVIAFEMEDYYVWDKANAEMLLRTDADEQRQAREHQQEK